MDTDLDWVMTDLMGVASRAELLRCGVTRGRLQSWVRRGVLIRTDSGLYVDPRRPDDLNFRRRRALAWAGRDALLSHGSAASVWGVADPERTDDVHVSLPHGRRVRSLSGVTYHQARYWDARSHAGWPVVTPRQLAVDLAGDGSVHQHRFVVLAAVQKGLLSVSEVTDPGLVPRRALARWAAVAQEAQAGARSGAEAVYWRAVIEAGLPEPLLNHPVRVNDRHYVVDALWPHLRLGVEIDGRRFHTRDRDFERDRIRQNDLHVAGLVLIRFTVEQVLSDTATVVGITRAALDSRSADRKRA